MREIYGFYTVLEQEALSAGDASGAAQARAKAAELRQEIKEKYSTSDEQVERVEATSAGASLEMEGANKVTAVLTELPGLSTPAQAGEHARTEKLSDLQNALVAQAEFQAEIGREPEIRRKFGGKPIDLNDTKQRQDVWRIMYLAYKKAGPGALGSLMALIGRYLKAFTVHTDFNIRDFGPNYLDSKFPVDLAGRAEKDCGVYALHVAWDVFQTVKQADSKLDVQFRLATSLDHVTLIIDDKSTAETYLVNNDTVTRLNQTIPESYLRPFFRPIPSQREWTGTYDDQSVTAPPWVVPEKEVPKEYADLRGLPYLATPFFFSDLGSTKDSVETFHSGVWANYLTATGEMANKEGALNQDLKAAKQGNVHGLQKAFAENAAILNNLMDQLTPFANDRDALESNLAGDMDLAIMVLVIFEKFLKGFSPLSEKHQFSYSWTQGPVHPLVRVALAILRLRKLGGTITVPQTKFLAYCEKIFKELAEQREAGEAGRF
jgi:hypothetical protein